MSLETIFLIVALLFILGCGALSALMDHITFNGPPSRVWTAIFYGLILAGAFFLGGHHL